MFNTEYDSLESTSNVDTELKNYLMGPVRIILKENEQCLASS